RIAETGLLVAAGNRIDLGVMRCEGRIKGIREILVTDEIEARQAFMSVPLEKCGVDFSLRHRVSFMLALATVREEDGDNRLTGPGRHRHGAGQGVAADTPTAPTYPARRSGPQCR